MSTLFEIGEVTPKPMAHPIGAVCHYDSQHPSVTWTLHELASQPKAPSASDGKEQSMVGDSILPWKEMTREKWLSAVAAAPPHFHPEPVHFTPTTPAQLDAIVKDPPAKAYPKDSPSQLSLSRQYNGCRGVDIRQFVVDDSSSQVIISDAPVILGEGVGSPDVDIRYSYSTQDAAKPILQVMTGQSSTTGRERAQVYTPIGSITPISTHDGIYLSPPKSLQQMEDERFLKHIQNVAEGVYAQHVVVTTGGVPLPHIKAAVLESTDNYTDLCIDGLYNRTLGNWNEFRARMGTLVEVLDTRCSPPEVVLSGYLQIDVAELDLKTWNYSISGRVIPKEHAPI